MTNLPQSSLPPEPIAYAQVSTADEMRWIVRFVGALALCLLCTDFIPLPYIWFESPASRAQFRQWDGIIFVAGATVAILAAIGTIQLRRVAILALAFLTFARLPVLAYSLRNYQSWQILPGYAVTALGQGAILFALWRRAERHDALIPPKTLAAMNPPATDDLRWFLRLAAVFVLLPVLMLIANITSRSIARQPSFGGGPSLIPVISTCLSAARIPIAIALLLGRRKALLYAAVLPLLSVAVVQIISAIQIGISLRSGMSLLVFQLPEALILSNSRM